MVDERVLLEGARQFDEKALAEIYDLYSPGIYGYAMRLAGNPDLPKNAWQRHLADYYPL